LSDHIFYLLQGDWGQLAAHFGEKFRQFIIIPDHLLNLVFLPSQAALPANSNTSAARYSKTTTM
jgi:hypothetical protein